MGLGDMLIKLKLKYGEKESIEFCDNLAKILIDTALMESSIMSKESEPYPKYKKEAILNSEFLKFNASKKTYEHIKEYGLKNSQLLTIAPTGSTGTMIEVSTGIEPNFAFYFNRKTESLHGEDRYYKVYVPIAREYIEENDEKLPNYFISAQNLNPFDRVKMQAVWQKRIDASISSTVNLTNDYTVEQVRDIYIQSWKEGLKGITIYRSGCQREGILTVDDPNDINIIKHDIELPWGTTIAPSDDMIGRKRSIMSGCGKIHIQAWFDPIDGRCMEIFLAKGSTGGCNSFMLGLSRMTSLALRTGVNFDMVIDQLNSTPTCSSYAVRSATKGDTDKGSSCPTALGNALMNMQEEIFLALGIEEEEVYGAPQINMDEAHNTKKISSSILCPECGEPLIMEGGCNSCKACSYSFCE